MKYCFEKSTIIFLNKPNMLKYIKTSTIFRNGSAHKKKPFFPVGSWKKGWNFSFSSWVRMAKVNVDIMYSLSHICVNTIFFSTFPFETLCVARFRRSFCTLFKVYLFIKKKKCKVPKNGITDQLSRTEENKGKNLSKISI